MRPRGCFLPPQFVPPYRNTGRRVPAVAGPLAAPHGPLPPCGARCGVGPGVVREVQLEEGAADGVVVRGHECVQHDAVGHAPHAQVLHQAAQLVQRDSGGAQRGQRPAQPRQGLLRGAAQPPLHRLQPLHGSIRQP